ncbi:cytochrome c [Alteromonas pelagimontana]|uniref:Cytochrome c n=1 Tax=Alteromonas pelagimontana TaxID=1858656 RepID=A0A6M4MC46_9ALTE|nr:cytochrome c [Alteromonas pelagimontana]QJR79726.1 cytochrome c [Alteromonas pelagimontana]
MKYMLKSAVVAVSLLSSLAMGNAIAEEASSQKHAEAMVTYRQSLFQLLKSNMGPLGGMAKGALPYDTEVMKTNGMRLEQLAAMMSDYVQVDTRKFDVETEAKPVIWEKYSAFEDKIEGLKTASVNLQKVAGEGDESAYRAAIGKVGAACKACHDDFKE